MASENVRSSPAWTWAYKRELALFGRKIGAIVHGYDLPERGYDISFHVSDGGKEQIKMACEIEWGTPISIPPDFKKIVEARLAETRVFAFDARQRAFNNVEARLALFSPLCLAPSQRYLIIACQGDYKSGVKSRIMHL